MGLTELIEFDVIGDDRGNLVSLESFKNIPFDIKRVYYIFETKHEVERGFHAHINLEQVAICLSGSVDFILDNGQSRKTVLLDSRSKGILIKGLIWREMKNFSKDAVVVVIANNYYDESDYIRDYHKFLASVKNT